MPYQYLLAHVRSAQFIAISAVVATLVFAMAYGTSISSTSAHAVRGGTASTPAGVAYLAGDSEALATTPTTAPTQGVNIANNGLVLLRGGRVLSTSDSSMKVEVSFGASTFAWVVHSGYNTKFIDAKGEKTALGAYRAGDYVTITGHVSDGGGSPAVEADYIRKM